MNNSALTSTHKTPTNPSFAEWFNQFFTELQAIFPAWRQAFPSSELLAAAKRQWLKAFVEGGIKSQSQIEAGLRKARTIESDFFPSPAKFIAWCNPSAQDLGLPAPETAYREAIDNAGRIDCRNWSHKAVYHAATQVGLFDLAHMTTDEARKAFGFAYESTCKAFMRGDELPEIPKAVASPKSSKADPDTARKHLDAMRAVLNKGKQSSAQKQTIDQDDPLLVNEGEAA